jgi:N-acylneuraminate cytidylyltransferase
MNEIILAIIPVRARDVLTPTGWITLRGKPLLDYTLQSARESKILSRVVVSTDSQQIGEYARPRGADAPFLRPSELAAPEVPLARVVTHCLDYLAREENYRPQVVVLLEVSHPLRPKGLIDQVVESLTQQELDTVFTVFESHHVFWYMSAEGELNRVEFEEDSPRATRHPLYGQLRGLVCATRVEVVQRGALIGDKVGIVPVRGLIGLVDGQEQGGLELAEFLLAREQSPRA